MQINYTGKTVVISGGTGGIGRATAAFFHELGANVFIGDLHAEQVNQLLSHYSSDRFSGYTLDVSNSESCAAFIERCIEEFEAIDFLVCGAGIYRDSMVVDTTDEEWAQMQSVTIDGVFYLCRATIPYIRPGGAIVNVASLAGHKGSYEHAHYAAAKGAVLAFTRSLAAELAPSIRVNAISPGLVDTGLVNSLLERVGDAIEQATLLKRAGRPEEIASTIAFLCSAWASFITGETIHVNGGFHIAS